VKKFFKAKTQRIIVLFTQKSVIMLSKIRVWDLDPEKPIPDPGSKRQRIPDPDLQDWKVQVILFTIASKRRTIGYICKVPVPVL
jgi:hypothetical protein